MDRPRAPIPTRSLPRTLVSATIALLALAPSACGDGSDPLVGGEDGLTRPGDRLRISPGEISLIEGESLSLTAGLSGPSSSTFDPSRIAWSSDDPSVAAVTAEGVVNAFRHGNANLTASYGTLVASVPTTVQGIPRALEAASPQEVSGAVGRALPEAISVKVLDKEARPLPNVEVRFQARPGGGEVRDASTVSDENGYATAKWVLGSGLGLQELAAAVEGLAEVVFRAEALPDYLSARIQTISGDDQEGEVAALLPDPLRIRAVDSLGHVLPGVSVLWTFHDGRGSSTSPPSNSPAQSFSTTTDGEGRTETYWELGTVAGLQEASASIEADSSGSSGSGTSAAPKEDTPAFRRFKAVGKPGKPAAMSVDPSTSSLQPGSTRSFIAVVVDRFGNPVSGAEVKWRSDNPPVASVDSQGTVEAVRPGSARIVASHGNIADTAEVNVTDDGVTPSPGMVSDLEVVSVSASSATLRWTGVDDGMGRPSNYALRYGSPALTWSEAESTEETVAGTAIGAVEQHTWTGLAPGTDYEFQLVSYRGTLTGGAVFGSLSNVVSGRTATAETSVASVTISPTSVSMTAVGETVQLTATARDAAGQALPDVNMGWATSNPSVATVDQGGRVIANASGLAMIVATAVCCQVSDTVPAEVSLPVEVQGVFFQDGFETGNFKGTTTESGWKWQRDRAESFPPPNETELYVGVSDDNPRSGRYAIVMQAPAGGEPWFEERFYFKPITKFWVEFYIHIPANYHHRTGGAGGSQHKFLNFWGGGDENYSSPAGRPDVLLELWPMEGGYSRLRVVKGVTGSPATLAWADLITPFGPFYVGEYNRFRMQVDMGSEAHNDGIIRIWANDKLVFETTDTDLWPTRIPTFPYFDTGYLLGYSNTGFNEPTRFHVDDWVIYATDPGW